MSKLKELLIGVGDGFRSSVIEELEDISDKYDDSKLFEELYGN